MTFSLSVAGILFLLASIAMTRLTGCDSPVHLAGWLAYTLGALFELVSYVLAGNWLLVPVFAFAVLVGVHTVRAHWRRPHDDH